MIWKINLTSTRSHHTFLFNQLFQHLLNVTSLKKSHCKTHLKSVSISHTITHSNANPIVSHQKSATHFIIFHEEKSPNLHKYVCKQIFRISLKLLYIFIKINTKLMKGVQLFPYFRVYIRFRKVLHSTIA